MKEKFCIASVSSFKDINMASTNNSKTKQTFSFNKTPRFEKIQPVCDKSSYGGDFIQHKANGAGIGYGSRYDFTKNSFVVPACNSYKWNSTFEENKLKSRGSSLGLSRQKVQFNQYINKETLKIPGSTKYQYERVQKYRSPSFSLRKKTKIMDKSLTLDPQTSNPGPGYYNEPIDIKVSKFAKIAYGTSKGIRFPSSQNGIPGVGSYANPQDTGSGKYINSKYRGGSQAKFNRQSRSTFLDEAIKIQKAKPGPGFYRAPSQFGQYDGDVYSSGAALTRFTQRKN